MIDNSTNGIAALAVANLVVLLLAYSIRQRRRIIGNTVPTLMPAILVIAVFAAAQVLSIAIASAFITDTRNLVGYAVLLGLLPGAMCLLLVSEWVTFRSTVSLTPESELPPETLDLETARRYVVWGEYENAKHAYLACAKANPKSPEPLFGLEGMYAVQGRFNDAAQMNQEIMQTFEHDLEVWTRAGERLAHVLEVNLNRSADADEVRQQIVRRNPAVASAARASAADESPVDEETLSRNLAQAHELAQKGSTDAAISVLKRLRQSNPRDPRPLFELALIYEADVQTEAAKRSLETAVRDFAGTPGVWADASIKLADLFLNRYGNHDAARELLERVVEKSPLPETREAARRRLDQIDHPWA